MQFETSNQGLVERDIGEDGKDVFEKDAGGWEIGELTQGTAQTYLKTGEFGGTGGMGGGESGDFGGGGIWLIARRML